MPSKQETFERVATHLLTQNCKSRAYYNADVEVASCAYRGDNGTKCAVGCLIDDEDYKPEFEGKSASEQDIATILERDRHDVSLCCELQSVHDAFEPYEWGARLKRVAKAYNLNDGIVDMIGCIISE